MGLCKGNLYEINFTKVYKAHATNSTQSLKKDGAHELWHHRFGYLNVKGVHSL